MSSNNFSKIDKYILDRMKYSNTNAYGAGFSENLDIYNDVVNLKSYDAIANIIDGVTLVNEQTKAIVQCLYNGKALIRGETGTGKTLLSTALMLLIRNRFRKMGKSSKFIFIAKASQLIQTPKKLVNGTDMKITYMSGEKEQISSFINSSRFDTSDIIMITHQGLESIELMYYLYTKRKEITGIFIDEAHDLCNYHGSIRAEMLKRMCAPTPYVYALTATPITSNVKQLLQLLTIVDPVQLPTISCARYVLDNDEKLNYLRHMIVTMDKKKANAKVKLIPRRHFVKPTKLQIEVAEEERKKNIERAMKLGLPEYVIKTLPLVANRNIFLSTRGEEAIPQKCKVLEIINNYLDEGKKGLIYIWNSEIRDPLLKFLVDSGIKADVIYGNTKTKDSKRIMEEFANGELDVVLTSRTEAVDLESDYVIFYEFTKKIEQMIGRAYRGFGDKTLYLDFIFTKDVGEEEYFYNEIYVSSRVAKNIFDLQDSEIAKAMDNVVGLRDIYDISNEEFSPEEDDEDFEFMNVMKEIELASKENILNLESKFKELLPYENIEIKSNTVYKDNIKILRYRNENSNLIKFFSYDDKELCYLTQDFIELKLKIVYEICKLISVDSNFRLCDSGVDKIYFRHSKINRYYSISFIKDKVKLIEYNKDIFDDESECDFISLPSRLFNIEVSVKVLSNNMNLSIVEKVLEKKNTKERKENFSMLKREDLFDYFKEIDNVCRNIDNNNLPSFKDDKFQTIMTLDISDDMEYYILKDIKLDGNSVIRFKSSDELVKDKVLFYFNLLKYLRENKSIEQVSVNGNSINIIDGDRVLSFSENGHLVDIHQSNCDDTTEEMSINLSCFNPEYLFKCYNLREAEVRCALNKLSLEFELFSIVEEKDKSIFNCEIKDRGELTINLVEGNIKLIDYEDEEESEAVITETINTYESIKPALEDMQ